MSYPRCFEQFSVERKERSSRRRRSAVLSDGTSAIPLKHTFTNDDGSETCSIEGATDFEHLSHRHCIPRSLGSYNHNTSSDREILAPTNDNIVHTNDFIFDKKAGRSHHLSSTDKIITMTKTCPKSFQWGTWNSVHVPGTPPDDLHLKDWSFGLFY